MHIQTGEMRGYRRCTYRQVKCGSIVDAHTDRWDAGVSSMHMQTGEMRGYRRCTYRQVRCGHIVDACTDRWDARVSSRWDAGVSSMHIQTGEMRKQRRCTYRQVRCGSVSDARIDSKAKHAGCLTHEFLTWTYLPHFLDRSMSNGRCVIDWSNAVFYMDCGTLL